MDGIAWEQQHFLSTLNSETQMIGRSMLRKTVDQEVHAYSYCNMRRDADGE